MSPSVIGMLSAAQLRAFAHDGYLVVPSVVEPSRCAAAQARIDELLRQRPPAPGHTGHHFYFEPTHAEPLLMGMLTQTAAWECAARLVAPLQLTTRAQVQVALTFPPYRHRPGGGHLDGLAPGTPGRPATFSLLAGIALSDQTRDDMGNLYVWPGSHLRLAAHLRRHGPEALLASNGHLLAGHGSPVQVHAGPGDLLLASYLLSHNIGGNTSSVVRKTLYFRLAVAGHAVRWREAVTDALAEFPAARAAAEPGVAPGLR